MMLYAQYRLVWRRSTVPMLLPLFWAVVWPLVMISDHADAPVRAIITGQPSDAVLPALRLAAIAIPASIGLILALSRGEAMQSFAAALLPGWYRQLRVATTGTAVAVSAACALLAAHAGGWIAGATGFALGIASFSVATALVDGLFTARAAFVAMIAFSGVLWMHEEISRLVQDHLVIAGPALLLLAGALLASSFSRSLSRRRLFFRPGAASTNRVGWIGRRRTNSVWTRALTTDRLPPLFLAALYAGGGGLMSVTTFMLLQAAVAVIVTRLMGDPWFYFLMVGMTMGMGSAFSRNLRAPVGREVMARIWFFRDLYSLSVLVAGIALLGPTAALLPEGIWMGEATDHTLFRLEGVNQALALAFALAPIAQWAMLHWGSQRGDRLAVTQVKPWLVVMLYVLAGQLAFITIRERGSLDPALYYPSIALVAVAVHGGYWLMVRRHFRIADLA